MDMSTTFHSKLLYAMSRKNKNWVLATVYTTVSPALSSARLNTVTRVDTSASCGTLLSSCEGFLWITLLLFKPHTTRLKILLKVRLKFHLHSTYLFSCAYICIFFWATTSGRLYIHTKKPSWLRQIILIHHIMYTTRILSDLGTKMSKHSRVCRVER